MRGDHAGRRLVTACVAGRSTHRPQELPAWIGITGLVAVQARDDCTHDRVEGIVGRPARADMTAEAQPADLLWIEPTRPGPVSAAYGALRLEC